MKILLVALNAKYIHSNLAVFSLKAYAGKYKKHIDILEYTINNYIEQIIRGIYEAQPDVVAFSCYIWNIEMIRQIILDLKKIVPNVKIWFGGPEVSYDPEVCLRNNDNLDGIMIGEGEQTFLELVEYYLGLGKRMEDIKGLVYKNFNNKNAQDSERCYGFSIKKTDNREPLCINDLPFPYEGMNRFKNKILYYESSRGCPFSCSYCLSSINKTLRLKNVDIVKKELKIFLDNKVPQVKFVDRTFNSNHKHALDIWEYIKENDNNTTNFHFEISADLLNDEDIRFLSTLRPGQVQFEIGVQSTNENTIKAVHRKTDYERVSQNVRRIMDCKNIHLHLDLIAGLPLEDLNSFIKSFNDVYLLRPQQLQLGFLKILKGSVMKEEAPLYGIVYSDTHPYEVLLTNQMTYKQILLLKGVCKMVDVYYNSGQFRHTMEFIEHLFESPFHFYLSLSTYYKRKSLDEIAHTKVKRFQILLSFYHECIDNIQAPGLFEEILYFDLCLRDNVNKRPEFAPEAIPYKEYKKLCDEYKREKNTIHIEHFSYDIIESANQGKAIKGDRLIIFDYGKRNPLNKEAALTIIIK